MTALSPVFLYGTDDVEPGFRKLAAGPLSLTFDRGGLRWISWRGVELLHGILFLARTDGWGTPEAEIGDLVIDENADHFHASWTSIFLDGDAQVSVAIVIEGDASGRLQASADIRTADHFTTPRTGFVALYPVKGFAGQTITVEHASDGSEEIVLPELISPSQPVFDIRAIEYRPRPGLRAAVRFEGDVFEMEDQRNWSDGSFKVYNRPLGWPAPYVITAEKPVHQSVTLSVTEDDKPAVELATDHSGPVTVAIGGLTGRPVPKIGVFLDGAFAEEAASLAAAEPIHANELVIRLRPASESGLDAIPALARFLAENPLPAALEILLGKADAAQEEIAAVAAALRKAGISPVSAAAFPKVDEASFQPGASRPAVPSEAAIHAALRQAFPDIPAGGGTPAYFPELNRKRPPIGTLDFLVHGTTAIVHAPDDRSVFETADTLPHIIRTARSFAPGLPYRLGPVGIGARINSYGNGPSPNPHNRRVGLSDLDPRQRGLFAAAWYLAYAGQAGGADELVFGAAAGPFGLIYAPRPHIQPWFDSQKRGVVPLYHLVADLTEAAGRERREVTVSDESRVRAFAWSDGKDRHLLIASIVAEPTEIHLEALEAAAVFRSLDGFTFEKAALDPAAFRADRRLFSVNRTVKLEPYAVIRVWEKS